MPTDPLHTSERQPQPGAFQAVGRSSGRHSISGSEETPNLDSFVDALACLLADLYLEGRLDSVERECEKVKHD